jgi:hypothetical protein
MWRLDGATLHSCIKGFNQIPPRIAANTFARESSLLQFAEN